MNGPRRRPWMWLATVALLALVLAGCGSTGAIGGGGTRSTGSATPSPSLPPPCAGALVAPVPPTVTLDATNENHTTTVRVSGVVEMRLDAQHLWRLGSVTPGGALTPVGPQGALERDACVWEFRVAQPGDAVVTFIGTARCPPNAMCPQYAILARFTIRGA